MASAISLKVYNKEGKLKVLVQEALSLKIVNIYKYDGEIEHRHSFTYTKDLSAVQKFNEDRITYYDYIKIEKGMTTERLWLTNKYMEHTEHLSINKIITTSKTLDSGNVYQDRKFLMGGGILTTKFKNDKMTDFVFPFSENKISEYLQKLSNGTE